MADSTKAKKNYVKGSAKGKVFSNGGEVINLDLKIEGRIIGSTGVIEPNEAGYAKITISKLPKPDDYGNTHSIYENDFKPDANKKAPKAKTAIAGTPRKAVPSGSSSDDSLPF